MRFEILGPVAVWDGDRSVRVGGPREQKLLTALLLNANRTVAVARLAAVLWADEPPATAREQINNSVAALRRALVGSDGERVPIIRAGHGLAIELADDQLDVRVFADRVAEADKAADRAAAAEWLRSALDLWRGPALGGIEGGILGAEARRLDEQRLACLERRIAVDLDLGRHVDVVGELAALSAEYPLREKLVELRLLALYRCGLRQEALAAYAEARHRLVVEAGLDPRSELEQLHQAILRSDPALDIPDPPAGTTGLSRPAPAQLSADVPEFTGRTGELHELDRPHSLSVITGAAGVGKTALAVHWAHRVRDRFPDGQLFIDLCGYSAAPTVHPAGALARFLRALGVPAEQIPSATEEVAALYRSLLADRRMLIVLDNANSADQIRPLLPGTGDSVVVVTSRDRLGGLVARDGARRLDLEVLAAREAGALLERIVGHRRVAAEPDAASDLVGLCAGLPLALRVTAAHLLDRPGLSIADHVRELRDGNRLALLRIDGDEQASVRAVLELSYAALKPEAQALFRYLGLVPGEDFTATAAATLADMDGERVREYLIRLVDTHLVDRRGLDRYGFHDLLREYARGRVEAEAPRADRAAARQRLYDWYLHSTAAADAQLGGGHRRLPLPGVAPGIHPMRFGDTAAAIEWLKAERANLLAAVLRAAQEGPKPFAWHMADRLRTFLWYTSDRELWESSTRAALHAARNESCRPAEALMLTSLGTAARYFADPHGAIHWYEQALALNREIGDRPREATILVNLAHAHDTVGHVNVAEDLYRKALHIEREVGVTAGPALAGLGTLCHERGRLDEAVEYLTEATRTDDGQRQFRLGHLSAVYLDLGQLDRARSYATRARDLSRELGDTSAEAASLCQLARVLVEAGDEQGAPLAREVLTLARKLGDRTYETDALLTLAAAVRDAAPAQAAEFADTALRMARQSADCLAQIRALTELAEARRRLGDFTAAHSHGRDAAALARQSGFRLAEARAQRTIDEAVSSSGSVTAEREPATGDGGSPRRRRLR